MAAEKLYYKDVYQRKFHAKVVQCRPGKKGYEVALDRLRFTRKEEASPTIQGRLARLRFWKSTARTGKSGMIQTVRWRWEARWREISTGIGVLT